MTTIVNIGVLYFMFCSHVCLFARFPVYFLSRFSVTLFIRSIALIQSTAQGFLFGGNFIHRNFYRVLTFIHAQPSTVYYIQNRNGEILFHSFSLPLAAGRPHSCNYNIDEYMEITYLYRLYGEGIDYTIEYGKKVGNENGNIRIYTVVQAHKEV